MQTSHALIHTDQPLKGADLPVTRWEAGVEGLLDCLNPWLEQRWRTTLVAGAGEPVYLPATQNSALHQIVFAHGYFNSALHELAHWCLAGADRRLLEDYGYWYCPDGRDAAQQAAFEQVEVKPQAIEWWFAEVSGRSFRTSTDNLNGTPTDNQPFREAVQKQAIHYLLEGLPARAGQAVGLLCRHFGNASPKAICFADLPD
ncbi:elongation factor P hydroxylase [Saccharospirillum impatiens]|uniref:elongation factor P hydroxylase n=1 Tax=Saccharospirillum impatiens TaxID=169438 RepID=UPI00041BD021|nr:elongation factor P hydroxylase [Saccharospirillum impatiens]